MEEKQSIKDFVEENFGKARWTTKFINDLPDSAFAIILPGGKKDKEGKTVPRDLRKLPFRDDKGNIDGPHVRNALARLPQSDMTAAQKKKAKVVLERALKELKEKEKKEKSIKKRREENPFYRIFNNDDAN